MALRGAGQTCTQTPHPVHASRLMTGRSASSSAMAPSTGHWSTQSRQGCPVHARHAIGSTLAVAITMGRSGRRTPGSQAVMQGVSLHMTQGCRMASMYGVPARRCPELSGAQRMARGGQAATQSPHRVHEARNCPSATAPGGRCNKVSERSFRTARPAAAPRSAASRIGLNTFPRKNSRRLRPRWSSMPSMVRRSSDVHSGRAIIICQHRSAMRPEKRVSGGPHASLVLLGDTSGLLSL